MVTSIAAIIKMSSDPNTRLEHRTVIRRHVVIIARTPRIEDDDMRATPTTLGGVSVIFTDNRASCSRKKDVGLTQVKGSGLSDDDKHLRRFRAT